MKTVDINGVSFSKVVCGSNAFLGRSHFSEARDSEYAARCSDAVIDEILSVCLEFGVNALECSASERIQSAYKRVSSRSSEAFHFIGNTRIDASSPMKSHSQKFKFLLENRAQVCVIHSQFVDRPRRGREINGLQRLVEQIHEAGLIAGISTHSAETVEICESNDYGVDCYLFPLNMHSFVYPGYSGRESVSERVDLIRGVDKPFVLMKSLAAGRIPPEEGLAFVLENCKENDIITLGLSSAGEARESLEIVTRLMG